MMADVPQIVVISGYYDLLERTQVALKDLQVEVRGAFSHWDSLYMLENEQVDLVLVDAVMMDLSTGEHTIAALAQYQHVPVILYARDGLSVNYAQSPVELVIGGLDTRTLQRSVIMALPGLGGRPQVKRTPPVTEDYLAQVQTLFSVSRSLTEVLDLSEVLNRVVDAARQLTAAEEGMILLPDDDFGQQLFLRARVGIDDEVARNFRIKTNDTLAGQVFHTGNPVLVGAQGPQKVKTQYFVNSLLYVPILLKGEPIGVLGVNNKSRHDEFSDRHKELLLNLASLAAIAIENARVHEETVQRTRELQSLVEAIEVVSASVALYETLPNICQQLARVLNVGWSAILNWDDEADCLTMMAQFRQNFWRMGQGPKISAIGILGKLADHDVITTLSGGKSTGDERPGLVHAGLDTVLTIPVRSDKRILGVVRAFYIDPPAVEIGSDAVRRINHLGVEGLTTVSNANGQSSRQVFRLLRDINRQLGADWGELALYASDGKALDVQVEAGAGIWLREPSPRISLGDYPDLYEALEHQQVFNHQAGSGSAGPGVQMLLDLTCSKTILGMPLIQRGQVQGLVLFGDPRLNREFSEREIDLGRAIVGQAATALENASLVHDLEFSLQELKDTQERLVQTARLSAMGELAAAVAHQINNPLTTILVDTELMLQDEPEDSLNYKSLLAISRAGKRAASVVRRLLATARPTEEDAPVEPIDIVDTIDGILSLVRSHIEQDRIRVLDDLPNHAIPPVMAVQGQIDDIWLNLLLNAHDALVGVGQEDGEIGIGAYYEEGDPFAEVVVWDNGPGIPEHIRAEIFKPFFTTKPVGEGTGLGLHICHQVIERIHGSMTVESVEGEGTRFLVRLPVKKGNE